MPPYAEHINQLNCLCLFFHFVQIAYAVEVIGIVIMSPLDRFNRQLKVFENFIVEIFFAD